MKEIKSVMFETFLQYLKTEKRYSEHTIESYKMDFIQFEEYLSTKFPDVSPEKVDHKIIRQWIISMMEKGLKTRSINRKITTLKSYFKFLKKENYISENPVNRVVKPKTEKRLPVFIEEKKMQEILDNVEIGEGFEAVRNKAIIEMFYATGIRLSELINLKMSDVNFDECTIKVLGKRNKERIIPISEKFNKFLEEYIKIANSQGIVNQDNTFFFLKNGKKLYKMLVYRIINLYISKVSSITKKSPHVIRHTFATHMLNNGADINAIKELLGHSSLAATQVYTHNTVEKLKKIYKQAHPRA